MIENEHKQFVWPYKKDKILKDYTGWDFQSRAVGRIKGKPALTKFSYKIM